MLLFSGYNGPPQRRMLWTRDPDIHCPFVAAAVRRDEIQSVLKCLHLRDNTLIDKANEDGYYKVRPIFKNLNKGNKNYLTFF